MLEISHGAGMQWMTPRGHFPFIFNKGSAAPCSHWARKVAPQKCNWIMGQPKVILRYRTSEGLTSEIQGWMGFLGCASESLPCRAAAISGKRSFVLILWKGVLSVCLFICVPPRWNPSSGRITVWKNRLLWGQTCLFLVWHGWSSLACCSSQQHWLCSWNPNQGHKASLSGTGGVTNGKRWEMQWTQTHARALCSSHFTSDRSCTHY